MREATVTMYHEDCVEVMANRLAENSIDLSIYSPPFEELFTYSGSIHDLGNNGSTVNMREGRFALNYRFFVHQLFKVTKPGTNTCCHIQQLRAWACQHGFIGIRDFRGAMIDVYSAAGFIPKGEFVICKNPQRMAQALDLHSLMFITGKRNSNNLAPAPNDHVLIFQKPGECVNPVRALYDKEINQDGWVTTNEWIRDAHGIWTDIQETDVMDGWKAARECDEEKHVCLARGSLVLTYNGYVPIQDVQIGDMVLTHKGRWRPVTAKACNGFKPVVKTSAQGVPGLVTTPDHRFWTRSCDGRGGNGWIPGPASPSRHRHNAMTAEPGWMEAASLKGSYVNLKLPPVVESPYTAQEWWIAGRWLGDGHYAARDGLYISCAFDELNELIEALGHRAGAYQKRRTVYQIRINDRDGRMHALLSRFGRFSEGKTLPGEALSLDQEKSAALLAGYLSADGSHVAAVDRRCADSVSRPLALGMAMVAQRVHGVAVSVYPGRNAGTCIIEGRTCNTKDDWVLGFYPNGKCHSGFVADDGAWKKVRSVEDAGETEVWDIQVAEDESFTAEGCIVHNCPLQCQVVYRLMRLYSNPISIQPDVLVMDPFGGIGTTACMAIGAECNDGALHTGHHRNVVTAELKDSYFGQSLANIEKTRKLVEAREREGQPLFAGLE